MDAEAIQEIANQLGIAVIEFATIIPWIISPYGAFINLLMPH